MRQPLVLPTSMYSMKRTMWPVPRQRSAIASTWPSFTPRLTTMLILIGPMPAAAAASMPSITLDTGKSASLMARNVASSSESRLTVTRFRPALRQRRRLLRQQRAVGGERQVEARDLREHRHQALQVAPHQRLAAGEADFLHAEAGEQARQARDLLEREHFVVRDELEVVVEHLARHAVHAAEVAAVGDRNAQVAQAAPERVRQRRPS